MLREIALALTLLAAAACIVVGVSMLSAPAAWIVAGLLVALVGVLAFAEVGA